MCSSSTLSQWRCALLAQVDAELQDALAPSAAAPAAAPAPEVQPAGGRAGALPPPLSKLVHAWALVLPGKREVRRTACMAGHWLSSVTLGSQAPPRSDWAPVDSIGGAATAPRTASVAQPPRMRAWAEAAQAVRCITCHRMPGDACHCLACVLQSQPPCQLSVAPSARPS